MLFITLALFILAPVYASLHPVQSNKPLYEFGVIGGAAFVPDYPASDQGRLRYLAVPQVRYRGLRFRSDEEDSMKARLLHNPVYGFDLSGGGAFSANSDKNDARKGMNDLDWVGELGPRFYIFLVRSERLWVRLFFPVRIAASTDLTSITYQGLVFAPAFNTRYYFDDSKFNSIILNLSRTHTTHQMQEFYFEVDRKYSTSERPEYDAKSGYMSSSAALAYIYEKDQIGIYGGFGLNSYKGNANAGSPLYKADYTYSAFVGLSYLFYQSKERGYQ